MKTVQPIRDKEILNRFRTELKKLSYRDYMIFQIGVYTGLRVSDVLKLQVKDIKDKTHITIQEQKTGKEKRFIIIPKLQEELGEYITGMADNEYLFKSQKKGKYPWVRREQVYRMFNAVAEKIGIEEVGTHTMRKTFGYWHYQQHKDVAILQDIFNHSAPSITLKYIGINDDIKDKTILDLDF